ncbi:MAG TPA: hypothetical protein DCQ79_08245 [Rhizobiales bacterium]|jgi:hypothetical protein|nr:hypothetical protein [Hyphomicrobiales bacterium]
MVRPSFPELSEALWLSSPLQSLGLALFSGMGSAPILRARIGVTHMATTPANRAVENGLSAQDRKQRRSDSRRDGTIVIIGVLTIIVAAIGAAITAFMG